MLLSILLDRESPAAVIIGPGDASTVFQAAGREFQEGGGRVSEATAIRVRTAAAQAPLAGEPFVYAAAQSQAAGNLAQAIRFLEEARRRDPRLRPARLLLVELYIRTGQSQKAVGEIAVLSRLMNAELSDLFVEELTLLAMDPRSRDGLAEALGNDPLIDEVLTRLVARGVSPDVILRLARPRMARYSLAHPPAWQQRLVEARIAAADYGNAEALWRRFNRINAAPGQIYNPGFRPAGASPPFGWQLTADENGVADPAQDGSLDVVYFGRGDTELARRMLLLGPGQYRLQLMASSTEQSGGSHVAWRVTCATGGAVLADLPLDRLAATPGRVTADFSVPQAGCGAQWVRLVGEAGEFPTRRDIRISAFAVTRGSGR